MRRFNMANKYHTRKLQILKYLVDTKEHITAAQISVSNANQYLISLEEMKLVKRHKINNSICKFAYVDNETEQKAQEYLKRFNFLAAPTPMGILNNRK